MIYDGGLSDAEAKSLLQRLRVMNVKTITGTG